MKHVFSSLLFLTGALLFGQGIYMDAKAKLSQILISSSWESRSLNTPPPKPWWWADTRAIAELQVPRLNKSLFVMQDDSGESLAFGPGYMPASAPVSGNGHTIIAGHRDSHFAFLKDIVVGDLILTENYHSIKQHYRVTKRQIIDVREQQIPLFDFAQLTLVTCYPFDDVIPGGPLRLIIHAELIVVTDLASNIGNNNFEITMKPNANKYL